jgi:hypothetical protein
VSGLAAAVVDRARLLGLEPAGLVLLALDALVVVTAAGALARRWRVARSGSPRELLAVALLALAGVVLPATALGAAGWLSNRSLLLAHAGLLVAVVASDLAGGWRAAIGRAAAVPWDLLRALARIPGRLFTRRAWRRGRRAESALVAGILFVLGFYALLAVGTLPLNYDAQTYRLSRVALWLQEGSIAHFPTTDERLSYVGQNADLVMLWIVSFFPREYPLVHLVQYSAGWLACGAVYELAALLGWRRRWRLAAVAMLLGMPSVGIQLFTAQTDLFTAATLATGVLFALVALRSRRAAHWLLAGVGCGLALGAKGTVLYFAPGLLLLFVGALVIERCPWRVAVRGAALAAAPVVLLSGFNFWQNYVTYGHPLAPQREIENVHGPSQLPGSRTLRNWKRLVWQVLEPGSNPFVPEALRAPLFAGLAANLERESGNSERWQRDRAMLEGRLDEDHASFGLVAMLAILAGGVTALRRSGRRSSGGASRAALMFGAVAAFLAFFCWLSIMNPHQFRYFALVGPFGALVAVSSFAGARSRATAYAGALLVAVQLVTALLVGVRSEYHGWTPLLDPERSTHHPHWRDRRALLDRLPAGARRLAIALPKDTWLAPYLRAREPREARLVPDAELGGAPSLGAFFARGETDALIVDPTPRLGWRFDDAAALPAPWILRFRQLAFVPLAEGGRARPAIVLAEGFHATGWTLPSARFELAAWSVPHFALELLNASPLARRITIVTSRERLEIEAAAHGAVSLEVEVAARDTVSLEVHPSFVPARDAPPSIDRRELGLLLLPSRITAESGVFGDHWTAPRATLRLDNWISGGLTLRLANPTPLARTVRVAGRHAEARLELAAQASGELTLAVLPRDLVTLEVEPPYVPAAGGSSDARQLGVLLAAELLRAPRAGEYR